MALPLRLADHAVFESYLNTGNEALVAMLDNLAGGSGPGCWLWGQTATGKTHLLQAVCDRAGDRSVYVPLRMLADAGPEILEGLASRDLICIDDIDIVAGDAAWESALFDLCNQILDADRTLVVSATMSPRECPVALPDLQSRLVRLAIFQVQPLGEDDRVSALQLRAKHRGLDLPDDTARFLLNRSRRDMASLYDVLDKLDLAALRAKRRLTIPFVKDVIKEM
ncbi:MAG: DnaA regulatory inactivator Hda [Gammaproteobacteria bacterium]|jgi:DnaA family protein|nr:DnaA regulatory inactivator Hda [Gammaproteobacteria bacterium]MDH3750766.1 DnaA regulatory inactivator Hda [Gammaproteobacteria bacterium]MDH3806352.1 DnaA regulatory inactivator Hda [Gammaproteobacteria bacterium]